MERIIKFKGLCKETKEWVFGSLIEGVGNKIGNYYILPNKVNLASVKHCHPLDGVNVISDSVSQFICIINSFEVWENDIIKCTYQNHAGDGIEFKGKVSFLENERAFCICKNQEYMPLCNQFNISIIEDSIEVIGNIFENPELLKTK